MKYKALLEVRVEVPVVVDADSEPKAIRKAKAEVRRFVSGIIKEKKLVGVEAVKE